MGVSPLAGKLPPVELLIDVDRLTRDYFDRQPDMDDARQRVSFGTSGHRGTPLEASFNEAHILAISQAICEYRASKGITGPLFLAKDTHAIDTPAQDTALEVLAANGVETIIAVDNEYTPVPVMSRAILAYNKGRKTGLADGIAVTPSHNPPRDGGFKYNPPTGGPADVDVTRVGAGSRQCTASRGEQGRQTNFVRACVGGGDDASAEFAAAVYRRHRECRGYGCHPLVRLADWGRSAGRGERAYLAFALHERYQIEFDGGESDG